MLAQVGHDRVAPRIALALLFGKIQFTADVGVDGIRQGFGQLHCKSMGKITFHHITGIVELVDVFDCLPAGGNYLKCNQVHFSALYAGEII